VKITQESLGDSCPRQKEAYRRVETYKRRRNNIDDWSF